MSFRIQNTLAILAQAWFCIIIYTVVFLCNTTTALATQPPWDAADNPVRYGKFEAYWGGSISDPVLIEMRGRVTGMEPGGNYIFLVPDSDYWHLMIRGNSLHPNNDQNGYADWAAIEPQITKYFLTNNMPVINLEVTSIQQRGTDIIVNLNKTTDTGRPPVGALPTGGQRPVQIGDRISILGILSYDMAHPPYYDKWVDPYCYGKGFLGFWHSVCYGHAELHPYDYSSIRILDDDQPCYSGPSKRKRERQAFIAPLNEEVYSYTYAGNAGYKGNLNDETDQFDRTETFGIVAPPRPNCTGHCALRYSRHPLTSVMPNNLREKTDDHYGYLQVSGSVSGRDYYNPTVAVIEYELWWEDVGGQPEDCHGPDLEAERACWAACEKDCDSLSTGTARGACAAGVKRCMAECSK